MRDDPSAAVMDPIDDSRRLPDNVFAGQWDHYLFFDVHWLFAPELVDAARELTAQAPGCWLRELAPTVGERGLELDVASSTASAEYAAFLRGMNKTHPEFYVIARVTCASPRGDWCLYGEGEGELAVLAVQTPSLERVRAAFAYAYAMPLDEALACESTFALSQSTLPEWRAQLLLNYGKSLGR